MCRSRDKMPTLLPIQKNAALFLIAAFSFLVSPMMTCAQTNASPADHLMEEIANSTKPDEAAKQLNDLVMLSTEAKKFDELFGFLRSLENNVLFENSLLLYYHQALIRYNQIQLLEDEKKWEELFDSKDAYYADIDDALEKIKKMQVSDFGLALQSAMLEWKLTKKKNGDLFEVSERLFGLAQKLAEQQSGSLVVIKTVANELFGQGETSYAKKLYNLYVSKITQSDIVHEELKKMATEFFNENNLDLAACVYAAYVDKLISTHQGKDFIMKEAGDIIDMFANTGWAEGKDPFFAEELFSKLEAAYTSDAFDGPTQLKRAYNLEKMEEYGPCIREYLKLVNEFPAYQQKDRVYFRLGVLSAYVLADRVQAKTFFSKVVDDFKQSKDYLNSAYQLGLLEQWEASKEKALHYYNSITEEARKQGSEATLEIARLAAQRTDEIKNNEDIEYNVRMFLAAVFDSSEKIPSLQLNLFAANAKALVDNPVTFTANTYLSSTGCLQQNYTYLWSGQLGSELMPPNRQELTTNYKEPGTKVVGVVLVDPTGLVSATVEIVDIDSTK